MAAPGASETVIVVTGGDPVDPCHIGGIAHGAYVIAADSGIDKAHVLGLHIDLCVGDFDSVSDAGLEKAVDAGARVERHPSAKDATDLELALDAAVARRPRRIHVLGGDGGRLDHLLANVALIASPRFAQVEMLAHMGGALITVVRTEAEVRGGAGDLVSLVPVHGIALGVTTEGLRYPLRDEPLGAGTSRGVSNELLGEVAHISLRGGVLLVVQPDHAATVDDERNTKS